MSIFGNIVKAIFGAGANPASASPASPSPAGSTSDQSGTASGSAGTASGSAGTAGTASGAAGASGSAAAKPMSRAELEAMLAKIEADRGVKYNWRQSIVDLMKLLDLDSSLAARKQLAQELGYKGALDGSADMNLWLHQQVMEKVAEGGGKVPASLAA